MSTSYHTRLKIENYTNTDITNISVSEIDNYDWDGGSRPDHNFHGCSISAGCSKEEREEVNANASNCPFRMKLTFRDGRECSFRINQKYVMGDSSGFSNYGTGVDVDYNKYSGEGHHGTLVVTIKDNQQYLERQRKAAAEKAAREEAARKAAAEKAAREEAARKEAAREEAARKEAAEKAAREEAARKEAAEKAAKEEATKKLEDNVEQLIEKVMELCGAGDHAKAANTLYSRQELSQSEGRDILGECNSCNDEYSLLVGHNAYSDYHFHQ